MMVILDTTVNFAKVDETRLFHSIEKTATQGVA